MLPSVYNEADPHFTSVLLHRRSLSIWTINHEFDSSTQVTLFNVGRTCSRYSKFSWSSVFFFACVRRLSNSSACLCHSKIVAASAVRCNAADCHSITSICTFISKDGPQTIDSGASYIKSAVCMIYGIKLHYRTESLTHVTLNH